MKWKNLEKVIAIFVLVAPAGVSAEPEPPALSLDGMELVEKDRRGEIYADPGVDWSIYDQILLDPATVAFRKNWKRDQNRGQPFKVKDSDMQKIKTSLSEIFGEVFTEELTVNDDYTLATESGDSVLRIKPHIVDLDVYAPDTVTPGITRTFTRQTGKMTLKLELYDSVTGDLIATASDRREAPYRQYMQWTTSVNNKQDARNMMRRWAKDLRKRLDEARSTPN